ncbi:hypothetical protein DV735_g2481, partial [Chaetothyriales sp. CBS 134920]
MTPIPPSVAALSSSSNPNATLLSDNFRVIRKRNRVPLSCAPCRLRKLKCNRQSPCDNCIRRESASACTYVTPAPRKKGSPGSAGANATTPDDMQNRINRLEGLVLSLMTNGSSSAGPTAATQALAANTADIGIDQERGKTIYIGEAHWAALLQEIGEVKNHFFRHKKEYDEHVAKVAQTRREVNEDAGAGPGLLLGTAVRPSRAEILAEIPSRYMSDILIRRYFSTFDPATNILHIPTFHRQYHAHWQDPSKTSIVWVAMLFAMMRLATISYIREGDEPPELRGRCHDMAGSFRTQMTHCLVMADYAKPHNHIIETLIFHLHAEYTSNRDTEASVWVLVGMIARLAMRMGYHRDPKLFPNLTPFQAEMRRRIWTFVRGADLLFSFQASLPSMVRIGDSDTGLPTNLFDTDFDEDSTVLPPSRPESEATPASYMIAKGKLALAFGHVVEEINGVNRKGYEEVLKIDRGLREVYDGIPDYLKLKSMQDINLTPMSLGMARFSLATMYHKSQCVLHSRYLRLARSNNRYTYSRRIAIESAMQLLQFQAAHHLTSLERDRVRGLSSYVNSMTTHDFSLAATVLGMDLYNHPEKPKADANNPAVSVGGPMQSGEGPYISGLPYARSDLIHALEHSRDIWKANQDFSVEAFKASKLICVLLRHLRSPPSSRVPNTEQGGCTTSNLNASNISQDGQSAAISPGMQTGPGLSVLPGQPNDQWGLDKVGGVLSPGDSMSFTAVFGNMGTMSTPSPFPTTMLNGIADGGPGVNLDWEMWDQYMQGSNITLDPASNLWDGSRFGMNSRYYGEQQNGRRIIDGSLDMSKQDSPMLSLSANSPGTNQTDAGAGEVFMGVPKDNALAEKGSRGDETNRQGLPIFNHNGHQVSKWIHPDGESGRSGFQPASFFRLVWRSSSRASSYTNVLWPFVPAAIALHFVGGEHHVWTFAINYIAMVPAANLLGYAGQELARKLPKVAGILIETCLGSVVEIVLLMVLVTKDKVDAEVGHGNLTYVIQAAILGSILTNLLLCLGGCFLVGGIRHREQTFHAVVSETGSGILLVAGFALLIPSAFYSALSGSTTDSSVEGEHSYTLTKLREDTLTISHGVACILIVAFGTFIVYNAVSHDNIFNEVLEADEEADRDRHKDLRKAKLTFTESIVAIVIALTLVSLIAVFLVEEIEYIVVERHVPDNFVPLVEKAAEHLTTIDEAYDNQINAALFHCIGPSIQTALFNGPLAVIVSWGLGKSLNLNFEIFMVVVLVLSILVVGNFLRDGSSNWLEGALLIIVYAIVALTTWYYPNAETTTSNGSTGTALGGDSTAHYASVAEMKRLFANSTNPSFDGLARKSHDKAIGGVFTYTNGADVDAGLADHRLDQVRHLANGNGSHATSTASFHSTKERAQSKPNSVHSIASGARAKESLVAGKSGLVGGGEGGSRLSNVEMAEREIGRLSQSPPSDQSLLSPSFNRALSPSNRLSVPSDGSPSVSPRASLQEKQTTTILNELPRLTQRHTLSVPKVSTNQVRSSREFSFAAGPSEEVLYASGRISPARDYHDSPVVRARRASLSLVRRTTRSLQSDAILDEIPQDEDAARWTEVIRQKRASRRRRREEDEDDDRVVVGKKVDEGHVNWVTAYNMLTGIRFTVSRINAKLDRELTDADFDAKHKFSFDVTGNELTPSAKYDFKFKDYAPWVFRHLRAIFGLDPADYLMSLTSKYILSELGSPGKSGSFFYFSRDYKYIIKTIHHAEHKTLRKILRDYHRHVLENPNTLISQIYGLHRVKIPYGRKIHFMVMNNLFPPHRDIHQTFDLKGSTIGRDYDEAKLASNPRATLKDLNWLRRGYHLDFDPAVKEIFLGQLKRDVALLQRLHIMDYSLLVGIHDIAKGNEENLREATLQVFHPGGSRDDEQVLTSAMLTRTPSRLENARKARELRLTLKKERPVALGLRSKMPEEMPSDDQRRGRFFYRDDGGLRGTHEDGTPGESIYYLGVIDCLTHYGVVKHVEHFWKGLKDDRNKISPIPPQAYGDRFVDFITGITITKEEAGRRQTQDSARSECQTASRLRPSHDSGQYAISTSAERAPVDLQPTRRAYSRASPPGSPRGADRTAWRSQKPAGGGKDGRDSGGEDERPDRAMSPTDGQTDLLPAVSEESTSDDGGRRRPSDEPQTWATSNDLAYRASSPNSSSIRMVSVSTKRDSQEPPLPGDERETIQAVHLQQEEYDEKAVFEQHQNQQQQDDGRGRRRSERPPRLNSDLIPRFSPMWNMLDATTNSLDIGGDPEKAAQSLATQ